MTQEKLNERFAQLERDGRLLLKSFGDAKLSSDPALSTAWILGAQNILKLVFSQDELFTKAFSQAESFRVKLEVFGAAANEFDAGLVEQELRETFLRIAYSDLINEAQSLLDDGFKRCAGVLARVALERHLRELASSRGLTESQTKNASLVNQDLWKQEAYNKGVWTEIDSWLTVGNEAAHNPDFEAKYEDPQVQKAITGIKGFIGS